MDLTPRTEALDALSVKRETSRWVIISLRIFKRDMDMTGAFDASTEFQLKDGDKR